MVELTCAICSGIWPGEIGDVDCPWCGGPNYVRITGEIISVTSIEDIDDALEVLVDDKSDVEDNKQDSENTINLEQGRCDTYIESIENYEYDIGELNNKKQNWQDMGIGGDD